MKIFGLLFIAFLISSASFAQLDTTGLQGIIKEHLPGVKQKVEKGILPGRYMCTGSNTRLVNTTDTIPGWEGFNVQLYEYTLKDKQDGQVTTQVYMLNADADRIARWAIAAAYMVNGSYKEPYIDSIVYYINEASNGQFPIRGIVYEDMDGNGIQDAYPFFDGVTAKCKNIQFTNPQRLSAAEQHTLLSMRFEDLEKAKLYGRIISTTRENYQLLYPNADVSGTNWCITVREEYKKALRSDVNYLINAWVKGHPQFFK